MFNRKPLSILDPSASEGVCYAVPSVKKCPSPANYCHEPWNRWYSNLNLHQKRLERDEIPSPVPAIIGKCVLRKMN
jgi:hypothetical protein